MPSSKSYIFVPYRVIITPSKARKSRIGFIFDQHPSWFEGDGRELDNILYVFLIYEKLKLEESFWFPYFEIIPEIETILDWTDKELE